MSDALYPRETWEWYGFAQHLIVCRDCQFHLATRVGPWLVSTVGWYLPQGREQPDEIGSGRLLETFVFRVRECYCDGERCEGITAAEWRELDSSPANTPSEARAAHMAMCDKWSRKAES